tara:strand:+ start:1619 stop:2164 length:546 start_codon:yes stop_codon:yes gene_type:complete
MIKLIGLTGKARSGKDTIGDYLSTLGYPSYAMAKPIKEACRVIFNWDDEHLYGDLKETLDPLYDITPREAMQKLGTEFGRDMINTRLWELRASSEISDANYLVITDLRYDNEAQLVLDHGGIVIRVERENRDKIQGVVDHPSEQGITPNLITKTIKNNGTLPELYKKVDNILNKGVNHEQT